MGVINLVSKSGTNDFHGSAFEFLRNNAMDARGFFAAATPILKQHDFGATAGGRSAYPRSTTAIAPSSSPVTRGSATAPAETRNSFPFRFPRCTRVISAAGFATVDGPDLRPSEHASRPVGLGLCPRPLPGKHNPALAFQPGRAEHHCAAFAQYGAEPAGHLQQLLHSFRIQYRAVRQRLDPHRPSLTSKDRVSFLHTRGQLLGLPVRRQPPGALPESL